MYLYLWVTLASFMSFVSPHGRFIEPPSRTSAWRFGFRTPSHHNDHETNCGGFGRQWQKNGGKCGICGDPWDMPTPRDGESGGKFGRGVIVRSYTAGQTIKISTQISANHKGYFEFRLCPSVPANQRCLDHIFFRSCWSDLPPVCFTVEVGCR